MKKDTLVMVSLSIAGLALVVAIIYGSYGVAKTVSYQIFYEDMVQQTVKEMVKSDALR